MGLNEMNEDHVYDVCIVGGGLGGLAVAIALLIAGFENIIICERDRQVQDRKQGYGLTLTNSLSGPIAKLQLLDACIAQNCLSQSHYTFTSSGEIIGYYGRLLKKLTNTLDQDNATYGGSRGNLRIPRQDFRNMMLAKIENLLEARHFSVSLDDIVQWGYKFATYDECEDYVTTTFEIPPSPMISETSQRRIKSRILLGADGIRSKVRVLRDQKLKFSTPLPSSLPVPDIHRSGNELGLHYLGINVILGISEIEHPLLYQKGYYVVDGIHRLFTMPYYTPQQQQQEEGKTGEASETTTTKPLVMWQLSYSQITETEAMQLRTTSTFDTLLSLALTKVATWFPSCHALIAATLPGEIWSTPLYDRLEMKVQSRDRPSRVTVLGDASHPMSMMKGQGANQALEDAILFVDWFSAVSEKNQKTKPSNTKKRNFDELKPNNKHSSFSVLSSQQQRPSQESEKCVDEDMVTSPTTDTDTNAAAAAATCTTIQSLSHYASSRIYSKIRNFEREMIARSFPKVLASREAAKEYHSSEIVHHSFGINGIKDRIHVTRIMELCQERHVNAYLDHGNTLDEKFEEIVKEVVFVSP